MARLVLLVGLGLLLAWPARAQLVMDASSGGVTGDSVLQGHVGWNQLLQIGNRGTNPNDPAAGPPTAGLEDFRTFRVLKKVDSGSAKLRERLVRQQAQPPMPTVVIEQLAVLTQCGGQLEVVHKFELGNVQVVEVKGAADENGEPAELVSFTFDTIEWSYTRCLPGSTLETTVKGWNLKAHTEI